MITNEELLTLTPLGGNIDVDKYISVINETQVFVIEPALGTKLYKKVKNDYEQGVLSGDYLELHENYIRHILAHHVAAEFILISSFNVANGGVFRYTPENAAPATKVEIDFLANKEKSKAEVYLQRMIDYLCHKNIPEYDQPQDELYDVKRDRDIDLFSGWRLSGKRHFTTNAEIEIWRDILNDEGL
jgi:hypothetical protein